MVLGIGGEEGWIHYEVIKRYKEHFRLISISLSKYNYFFLSRTQNLSANYKNDISRFSIQLLKLIANRFSNLNVL